MNMNTNEFTTNLIVGIAAVGIAALAVGVALVRRRRSANAAGDAPANIPLAPVAFSGASTLESAQETMETSESGDRSPTKMLRSNNPLIFFLLVIAITIPYWIFGGKNLPIPVKLPVSAFAAFNPMIAALILVFIHRGAGGVKELFNRAFDARKIINKKWYIPILLLSPLVYILSYAVMRLGNIPLPDLDIQILMIPVFLAVFFLFGIGEELGWMGYAIDPLQNRWGALKAAIFVGVFWGLFHLIPDLQNNQSADWILWQRLGSVFLRILIVWIYNNTGKSVFSSVLFHTMNNLSWSLFPNFGTHYDPFITGLILIIVTGLVLIGWDAKTLTRYRLAGVGLK